MFDPITAWIEWKVQAGIIALVKAACNAVWYVQKVIGWLGDQMMSSTAWQTVLNSMFASIKATMPATLRTLMFGVGGGLFYLAIIAVGLFLIVPQMVRNGNRPVELDRVLMWSIFVIALFISSTAGYDLLISIENARQDIPRNMASQFNGSGQTLSNLVAAPMSASAAEITFDSFGLPANFVTAYFPPPSDFTTREIVFYDAPLLGSNKTTIEIETADSLSYRLDRATLGFVIASINSIPAAMVLTIMISLAALTASALVILLFFVMGLPLGLFEFGQAILAQVFKRYLFLWILSILIGAFPAILINTAELLLAPPVTLSRLFTYILLLIIALLASTHIAKIIFHAATASFSLIGHSINAAATPFAAGVNLPRPRRAPPLTASGTIAGSLLTGTAIAAATPYLGALAAKGAFAATAGGAMALGAAAYRRKRRGKGSQTDRQVAVYGDSQDGTMTTPAPPQRTHVFAYLDDPNIVEGEWTPVQSIAGTPPKRIENKETTA